LTAHHICSRHIQPAGNPPNTTAPRTSYFPLQPYANLDGESEATFMAQTIWIHRLTDKRRKEAEGMDFVCEHLFQEMTDGKLTQGNGWNPVPDAESKEGEKYRSLFCDMCHKNYNRSGHVRLAREAVLV
jgi:hypothetical protein